jgi:hypothetical protein
VREDKTSVRGRRDLRRERTFGGVGVAAIAGKQIDALV